MGCYLMDRTYYYKVGFLKTTNQLSMVKGVIGFGYFEESVIDGNVLNFSA